MIMIDGRRYDYFVLMLSRRQFFPCLAIEDEKIETLKKEKIETKKKKETKIKKENKIEKSESNQIVRLKYVSA